MRETHLHGAIDVATEMLGGGTRTIAAVHGAIARKPFVVLRRTPGVGDVSETVRVVHDGITRLVYAGIGATIAGAGAAARLAASMAGAEDREPRAGSLSDLAVGALNGFAG